MVCFNTYSLVKRVGNTYRYVLSIHHIFRQHNDLVSRLNFESQLIALTSASSKASDNIAVKTVEPVSSVGVNVAVLAFVVCFLSPAQSSVVVYGQADFRGRMGRVC